MEKGQTIKLTGSGQAEIIANDSSALRLEIGETATLTEKNDTLKLTKKDFMNSIDLENNPKGLEISGPSESELTLFTGINSSLQFSPGDTGTIQKMKNGKIKINNKTTGQTLTVGTSETLKAEGNAEIAIGDELEFQVEEGDQIQFTADKGELEIRNKSITRTAEFGQLPKISGDEDFQILSDPASERIRIFDSLISIPGATLSLTESKAENEETKFGTVDQIIQPFNERELNELGNVELNEEVEPPFFADRRIAELMEDLPDLINSDENELEFFGEEKRFTILDEEGESFIVNEFV